MATTRDHGDHNSYQDERKKKEDRSKEAAQEHHLRSRERKKRTLYVIECMLGAVLIPVGVIFFLGGGSIWWFGLLPFVLGLGGISDALGNRNERKRLEQYLIEAGLVPDSSSVWGSTLSVFASVFASVCAGVILLQFRK